MSVAFTPVEVLEIYCRFCGKVTTNQLDRSIAGNGRTIDKNSTFEYYCTKCYRTSCYSGRDLIEPGKGKPEKTPPRDYSPSSHYLIGERVSHKKFKETGLVVSTVPGTPHRILVDFPKHGLVKLVEDMH